MFLDRRPATRWPKADFLPAPRRPPWLAWLWMGCAALVLAVAVDDWLALDAEREDLRALVERSQAARRASPAAAPARSTVPAGAALAASAVVRRLVHPWRSLFEAAEQRAAEPVRWLRMDHDAERGDVRLEGVAPSRDAVLKTLDGLAAQPGWSDLSLLRVELADAAAPTATAGGGLRFELRARLAAAESMREPR